MYRNTQNDRNVFPQDGLRYICCTSIFLSVQLFYFSLGVLYPNPVVGREVRNYRLSMKREAEERPTPLDAFGAKTNPWWFEKLFNIFFSLSVLGRWTLACGLRYHWQLKAPTAGVNPRGHLWHRRVPHRFRQPRQPQQRQAPRSRPPDFRSVSICDARKSHQNAGVLEAFDVGFWYFWFVCTAQAGPSPVWVYTAWPLGECRPSAGCQWLPQGGYPITIGYIYIYYIYRDM